MQDPVSPIVGKEVPTREIECGHCHAKFRIHEPILIRQAGPAYTQLLMIPSWSLDERICPHCKTLHAAIFAKAEVTWISTNPQDNQPKIVPAGAPVPLTPEQMTKLQENIKNRG